jgi:hypothetical protein
VIASAGPNAYGAAWYRLFPARRPGFGFVDEETPELTIAVVPSQPRPRHRRRAARSAARAGPRRRLLAQISLSAEPGQTAFYESHGFRELRREDEP